MSGFDKTPPEAAEHFARLAEELLEASLRQTTTDAAGRSEEKSLAMQQLEATQANAAIALANFHSFHVRAGAKPSWPDEDHSHG